MTTRRRLLMAFSAGALSPRLVLAQSKQVPATARRIGLLSPFSPAEAESFHRAFRDGLRELGWVEGKNIIIEYRHAEGRSDRIPALAVDLVRLKVDVIVTSVSTDTAAAHNATATIPIVMAGGDPVALGLADTLARPNRNITGLSTMTPELSGKRLELLKEMVPKLSRVAVLWNPQGVASTLHWKEIQDPARKLGLHLHSLEVRSLGEFDKAFDDAARAHDDAVFVTGDPVTVANLKKIADLAAKKHLPSICHFSEFADAGGLVAYGTDRGELFRRAATYVDKILKGAKPGELPIDRATKFELIVNQKTAKALGITIPQSILVRADRVIE